MDWIVCLTPDVAPDPLDAISRPPDGATLVELRLDLFPGLDPAAAVAACPLPVIATLRSAGEGGSGPDDPAGREALIRNAVEAGAALVDLEAARDRHLVDRLGLTPDQVVLSWHDPDGTPADLSRIATELLDHPARWTKLIPTARSLDDVGRLVDLHPAFNASRRPSRRRLIAFSMGDVGLPTRYLAPVLGPPLAYVAWTETAPAAPGQVTREQLHAAIGHLSGPPARLFAVVGRDVGRSLSPSLHGAGFQAAGLFDLMIPVNVPDEQQLKSMMTADGGSPLDRCGVAVHGLAVTTPYKRAAASAATVAAPRVLRARSANTLILRPGRILADTTDADGVVGALVAAGIDPSGLTALVQGTGGAARAAAVGLDLAGADVRIRGRDVDRTRLVSDEITVDWMPPEVATDADIVVNATPLGASDADPLPFTPEEMAAATAVVEMVYRDRPTRFEAAATAAGLTVVSGREMLLHQGLAQFAAFTARVPPRDAMRRALGLE